jgi:MYXO-CTERM domain-containing protein
MPTSRSIVRSSLAALTLAVPLAWGAAAQAQAVCGEQTCPKNYECASEPNACPDIACAEADCAPCTGTTQYCAPLPCESDADCADDMVCYKQTQETCPTAPPCAKGADCAAPADTACTSETISACVPRYLAPCQADADCGVGFTCEEEQECSCSGGSASGSAGSGNASGEGSSPAPAADGGAADPVPPADGTPPADGGSAMLPPDCSCQPSGTKACNLKAVACSVDQGCPAGWTCGENPSGVCSSGPDGSSCTADPPKICLPPYSNLSLGRGGHAEDGSGTGVAIGGSAGAPSGTGGDVATPDVPTPNDGSKASPSAPAGDESDSGCAVGHARGGANGSFGLLALAFAGLAGLRRRRSN